MTDYNVDNNFTNYSDSEYTEDTEDTEDTRDIIYEPEESSFKRFTIALCELFNEKIHGNTSSDVKYHYLVNTRFKQLNMNCINEMANFLNNAYMYQTNLHHYIFKNYRNMILNGNYIKPEIVEILWINDIHEFNYCVAIIKTFWIKIIQRTWKNILIKREEINMKRKQISSLQYKEIHGRWPDNCLKYPGFTGMLVNLKT
jgi:hypothetical protein